MKILFPEHIYQEMLHAAKSQEHRSCYAISTIKGIYRLAINSEEIASTKDQRERYDKIRKYTKLLPEKDFSAQKTEEDRMDSIARKVSLLINSYQDACENGTLEEYFKKAFASDPCFNGRINTLKEYVVEKWGLEPTYTSLPIENSTFLKLLDYLMCLKEELDKNNLPPPNEEEFREYLQKRTDYEEFAKYVEGKYFSEIFIQLKEAALF